MTRQWRSKSPNSAVFVGALQLKFIQMPENKNPKPYEEI